MKIYNFTPRALQTLVWIPARLGLHLFTGFKLKGKKNLKEVSAPVIFASNHSSEMDPIVLPAALNPFSKFFPIYYVARGKGKYDVGGIKRFLYGGAFFHWWGAYQTVSGFKNYETSLQVHARLLNHRKSIHLFPQGRIHDEGDISGEVRGGIVYLAWKTKTPVVPLAIKGTYNTSVADFLLFRKSYTLSFGKAIDVHTQFGDKEPTVEECHRVAEEILTEIKELYQGLR